MKIAAFVRVPSDEEHHEQIVNRIMEERIRAWLDKPYSERRQIIERTKWRLQRRAT